MPICHNFRAHRLWQARPLEIANRKPEPIIVQCSKIINSVGSGHLSSFGPSLPAKSTPGEHFAATTLATVAGEVSGSRAVGLRDSRRRFRRRSTRLPLDLHLPAWIRTPSCAAWELFFYTLPLPGSLRQRARSNIIGASKFAGFSAHWRPIWNHERRRQTQRRRAPDRGRRQDQAENQEALHV